MCWLERFLRIGKKGFILVYFEHVKVLSLLPPLPTPPIE